MTSPAPADAFRVVESDSPYAVKLPLFEGPLDLLLHLIRLNEVEITISSTWATWISCGSSTWTSRASTC